MADVFKHRWMTSTIESRLADVKSNLAVLGQIKDNDRLCLVPKADVAVVDGTATLQTHTLNIDQRWIQPVIRTWTGDGRTSTMAFAEMVLDDVQAIATIAHQSYQDQERNSAVGPSDVCRAGSMFVQSPAQVLDELKSDLSTAIAGINRLKSSTYAHDRQFCIDIDTKLVNRINLIIGGIKTFFTKPVARPAVSTTYADRLKSKKYATDVPNLD
jgi:hypothetical protein